MSERTGNVAGNRKCIVEPTSMVKVGIWNGMETVSFGRLLYRTVLREAIDSNIRGGVVLGNVEGSRSHRAFRSVESEVSSNELPLWMLFVDSPVTVSPFVASVRDRIQNHGVVVEERVCVWSPQIQEGTGRMGVTDGTLSADDWTNQAPSSTGLEVQIFTLEGRKIDGKPVYQAAAEYLRSRGVLWISTTRAVCGFGEGKKMHRSKWFTESDVPIVMSIVDRDSRLRPCLPELAKLLGEQALLVSSPVDWHHPADG